MTDQPDGSIPIDASHVLVVGPDGEPIGALRPSDATNDSSGKPLTELVEQPAKVMRIGAMIKQLLEEVKDAPLDVESRARLGQIYDQSIAELKQGLAPELSAELDRITSPFNSADAPTEGQLRVAHAQLVGWLEGLFHGIQTALFAQQMAARAQLEGMRRGELGSALPTATPPAHPGGGQYL